MDNEFNSYVPFIYNSIILNIFDMNVAQEVMWLWIRILMTTLQKAPLIVRSALINNISYSHVSKDVELMSLLEIWMSNGKCKLYSILYHFLLNCCFCHIVDMEVTENIWYLPRFVFYWFIISSILLKSRKSTIRTSDNIPLFSVYIFCFLNVWLEK